jgi:hypothetical protein
MKTFASILLFIDAALGSWMAALVITWSAWEYQITEKAFHCTDGNFSGFWCDMDAHRQAGDTLLGGWTWDKLKLVRSIYEIIFYVLWIGGGLFVFRALRRLFRLGPQSPPLKRLHPLHA